uniref:COesterase domain-containing protein n=1 Tax=Panagrellus redivivus TaxID=6233 RepID=A0A7E4ZZY7_PANRE
MLARLSGAFSLIIGRPACKVVYDLFKRAGMSSGSRRFCQESKGRNGDARKTQNQALIETYCPHIDDSKLPNADIGKQLEECLLSYSNEKLIEIQMLQQVGFAFVVDSRVINNPYLPSFDKDPITVNHDMLYSSSAQEYASLEDIVSTKTKTWNRDSLDARIAKLTLTGCFPPSDTDLYRSQFSAIKENYLASSTDESAYRDQVINAFTDVGFVLPAIRSIALANSSRVYYLTNAVPFTPFLKEHFAAATHSSDINRLFPSYIWTGNNNSFTANLEFELISVNNFAEIWSSFAKTGKPTANAVPAVTDVMFFKDRISPLACTVIKADSVEDTKCDHTSKLLYEELPSLFYWNQTTLGFFD